MQRRTAILALTTFICGVVLGGLFLVVAIRSAVHGFWNLAATRLTHRSVHIDLSQPTVVAQIQRLARLETVTYTMDKVVEGDKELPPIPDFLVGDKLVLVAEGHAIAGVDLSKLASSNVRVEGRTVSVRLPPAQLLAVALDEQKTHVYSRSTGILVPVDPNLESQVRAQAQQDLQSSALQAGILGTAEKNACSTIRSMLLGLDFQQVNCS